MGILHADDQDFTAADKEENKHFWWLDRYQISKEVNRSTEEATETARRLKEADDEAGGEDPGSASPGIEAAKLELGNSSKVRQFFTVIRLYETTGGKKGSVMKCNIQPERPGGASEIFVSDSTNPLWKYVEKYHKDVYQANKGLKESSREVVLRDGSPGLKYMFLEPQNVEQNLNLVKLIAKKSLPLSFGETDELRAYARSLDPRSSPADSDTATRLLTALAECHENRRRERLRIHTKQKFKIGIHSDMMKKGYNTSNCYNFTFVEKVQEDINAGIMGRSGNDLRFKLQVTVDILSLKPFTLPKTGINLATDFEAILLDP